jgi:hypothetical protein
VFPSALDPALRLVLALTAALSARVHGDRERGDVPGWVLVTLMTAGLVTVLWALAGTTLQTLFTESVAGVTGPGAG